MKKEKVYLVIGSLLLSITIGLLFGIVLFDLFNFIGINSNLSFVILVITIICYLIIMPKSRFNKIELTGIVPKYGKQREFNEDEIKALESEAEHVKRAREYFDNKSNYKECQ